GMNLLLDVRVRGRFTVLPCLVYADLPDAECRYPDLRSQICDSSLLGSEDILDLGHLMLILLTVALSRVRVVPRAPGPALRGQAGDTRPVRLMPDVALDALLGVLHGLLTSLAVPCLERAGLHQPRPRARVAAPKARTPTHSDALQHQVGDVVHPLAAAAHAGTDLQPVDLSLRVAVVAQPTLVWIDASVGLERLSTAALVLAEHSSLPPSSPHQGPCLR